MSQSRTQVVSARRVGTAAKPYGSPVSVRRFVFCSLLFTMFAFSSIFFAAEAEAAANTSIQAPVHGSLKSAAYSPVETMQDSVAAWSCRGVYHVVGRGETIYSIARRYGTTAYRIAVCNGLASYTVYVGQTLLVPTGRS